MATIDLLEETANYLLNHCFVLGCVEEQRAKYLYIQDHLNEVRAVFKPLGYAVLLYPAPMQAAALVNEHEGSQARLLKYESILLLSDRSAQGSVTALLRRYAEDIRSPEQLFEPDDGPVAARLHLYPAAVFGAKPLYPPAAPRT